MELIILIVAIFALTSHLMGYFSVFRELRRRPRRLEGPDLPMVSILKPLRGVDDQLEENLESYFRLDYPNYEIIFCAADPDEPALEIAQQVRARHPDVSSRLVTGAADWLNPKVSVLGQATPYARGELLLISDSNVRVRPSYLRETGAELEDPDVAVVSNLVAGIEERSLGATFENLQLNGFIAPAICLGLTLRALPCVVGKSMMIRRSDLEAIGGWAALGNVLAEDYVLGRELSLRDRRAVICPHVVETINEEWSLGRFLERHDRWLKMRWRINPYVGLLEIVTNVTLMTLLWIAVVGVTPTTVATAALLLGVQIAFEAEVSRRLRQGRRMTWFRLLLVPIRDLALALLWAHSRFSRRIRWRHGQVLQIGRHSRLTRPRSTDTAHKSADNVALGGSGEIGVRPSGYQRQPQAMITRRSE
jgi:ceramide glucosyltransferase